MKEALARWFLCGRLDRHKWQRWTGLSYDFLVCSRCGEERGPLPIGAPPDYYKDYYVMWEGK